MLCGGAACPGRQGLESCSPLKTAGGCLEEGEFGRSGQHRFYHSVLHLEGAGDFVPCAHFEGR